MKRAVLGLKERLPDTTFLCLSNSNEVYISTILEVNLNFSVLIKDAN
jgi:pyridoxal phosphate phosphatase PHOSPHO2